MAFTLIILMSKKQHILNFADEQTQKLIELAQSAMKQAYAPYSGFHVGAALIDENGQMYRGCNVENAAYPEGICAEGSAIAQMVCQGGREIRTILLVSSGNQPVMPCGGCCQKNIEFCGKDTQL